MSYDVSSNWENETNLKSVLILDILVVLRFPFYFPTDIAIRHHFGITFW